MRIIQSQERSPATSAGQRCSIVRGLLLALVVAGCSGAESVAPYTPITDPAKLYMAITLDHRAITLSTLAPYDTLQLAATPRDGTGTAMTGLPSPTFTSSDTTVVWVTAGGLLQARAAGSAMVIAELRADGNVRHTDTAFVNVTYNVTPPPMLATLSIHPPVPGDTVWSMIPLQSIHGQILMLLATQHSPEPSLTTRTLDADGNPIPSIAVEYQSLDPDIVELDHATIHEPLQPGTARIVARATAYGVTKVDTARFTVTLPFIQGVVVQPGTDSTSPPDVWPTTVQIRAGGYVFFTNMTGDSVHVTFADPAGAQPADPVCSAFGGVFCDGGDIPNFVGTPDGNFFVNTRGRHFTTPGTYVFHIEPLGVTGQITVDPYPTP